MRTMRALGGGCGPIISWLLILMLAGALRADAQLISGDLVVRVADPTDLIVPGATLSLTEVETAIAHSAVTDTQGTYLFGQLKPGSVQAGSASAGLQDARPSRTSAFRSGQRARVDVKLVVGAVTEDRDRLGRRRHAAQQRRAPPSATSWTSRRSSTCR